MKCERCGKEEAVVRITRISPEGHKTTVNLGQCDECLEEMKYPIGLPAQKQPMDAVLKELLQHATSKGELAEVPMPDLQCTSCGLDLLSYRTTGMLGCADCYDAFEEILQPELQSYHRATHHIVSEEDARREELAIMAERLVSLRNELREAVEAENFSHAAWLRDEATQIEARLAAREPEAVVESEAKA